MSASCVVYFSCPSCGEDGYEIEFEPKDIEECAQISFHCDSCADEIAVDADVRVRAVPSA